MYQEINEKLAALKVGMARLKQINITLLMIKAELQTLQEKEKDLKIMLECENYGVESLDSKGLASFFYSKIGTLDKHLEKERGEALSVKLTYQQVVREIDDIEHRIANLEAESQPYKEYQAEYDSLFEQKRTAILKDNGEAGRKITALTEEVRLSKIKAKEINDTASSANNIIAILNDALDCIIHAEIASEMDRMDNISSGLDLFEDLEKHSFLDQAKTAIDIAKVALNKFQTDLFNIEITAEPRINTDGFAKFADIFFDGRAADRHMRYRINDSKKSIHDVKYQVTLIAGILQSMETSEKEKADRMEAEIHSIIAAA